MTKEIQNHIAARAKELYQKVKSYREHLHAHPELSYKEYNTMQFVFDSLTKIGLKPTKGIGGTGVTALITNDKINNLPCVGLRADLDALPIEEENDVDYKSTVPGVMHACGHDVHTSILLGVSEILHGLKDELSQPVKLIFQPGEEQNPGGASYMIRDGVLENPTVERMYALHVFPELEHGSVGFKEGLYMASCDEIHLTINGKGGHGAMPHNCIDPILIGTNIVQELQQVVSRYCDPKIPSVLTIGHFEALGATNVIPSKAILRGTFRTMNETWRKEAHKIIEKICRNNAENAGGTIDFEISKGYPFLENDVQLTHELRAKAVSTLGEEKVVDLPIRMTAEDFSYYAQEVPVCFFRLGVANREKNIVYGVHHPKFDIDPKALITGMTILTSTVF